MGFRFSVVETVRPTSLDNGILTLTDLDGKTYKFDLEVEYSFKEENKPYKLDVPIHLTDDERTLIVRRTGLWSMYRNSDRLLLDIGYIDILKLPNNDDKYTLVGYYYTGKEILGICYSSYYNYAFLFDIQRRKNRGILKIKCPPRYKYDDAKSYALGEECVEEDSVPQFCISTASERIDGGVYFEDIHVTY